MKFYTNKVVATTEFSDLIFALNTRTRDGYIVHQERIERNLWLIRIACTNRDDAELIRGL